MNIYNIFDFIIKLLGSKPMKTDKVLTTFDEIIEITLHHEGGYVHDPKDAQKKLNMLVKKGIDKFIKKPIKNPIAKKWIEKQKILKKQGA